MVVHVKLAAALHRLLESIQQWWWNDEIARQRHLVEEDARRLGGKVMWE